jgi:Bacterial Ig-like domain (group 3)
VGSDMQMLNSSGGVVTGSNVYLGGVGQGAAVSSLASPATYSLASGLSSPKQVAADAQGDSYVADAGLAKIEKFAAGTTSPVAGTPLGSSLSAPTGVAVDLAGDVFIGDSGKVYEIPFINGALATSQQTQIASGLGSNLNLAVDPMGDVFVADQANKQVVEISNAQSALLRQALPALQTLGSSANFTGPTAVATDNSGNVWVADGTNLWEITMPFGGVTEITTKLPAGVTGLAVDPSGSVFVSSTSGVLWIPYQVTSTSSGLNVNAAVLVTGGLGSASSEAPSSLALDGSENLYADYGSGSSAGLSQLSINGAINFDNDYAETNPAVPYEADAQLFNLGNASLSLGAFANDTITQPNSGEFSLLSKSSNTPACSASTSVSPGDWCYLGFNLLDSLAPPAGVGETTASAVVTSNAANASSGLNIGLSANIVQDDRPATSISVMISPSTSPSTCAGSTYPGCQTISVVVSSATGTPQGSVILKVPGSGVSQEEQSATVNSSGLATFTLTNLTGGTYNVLATYGGEGAAGTTQNSCSPAGSTCFAGSASTTTFTIGRATPTFVVGPPGNEACLTWTATGCVPNPSYVTSYLGTDFVQLGQPVWFTASVTSGVGTPTGSVSFLVSGKPVDPTQPQNSLSGNGIADFTLANLAVGSYTLTAQYNGDQNYLPATLAVPTFQVIIPSVEITSSPATVSTAAGTPVEATLNLMPLVGFSNDVSLECVAASLPQYTECTFAYPNTANTSASSGEIEVNGTSPSTIVVTISTNVPVNSGMIARQAPWELAGLFGLGLLGLIAGRRRLNRYLSMLCVAMMFSGLFVGLTSCTNSGYSTPPSAPKVLTPANTYNVQVISYNPSNAQQNSLANTPSYTLQLTVE